MRAQNFEDGGHETEGNCWRICVHLNPEREKLTNSILCFFFVMTDHTSARYAPSQPQEALAALPKSSRAVVAVGGPGMHSNTREQNQTWLCEHIHCAYLLSCAHPRSPAGLNFENM